MVYEIHIPEASAGGLRRMVGEVNFALGSLAREVSELRAQLEALRKEQENGIYEQSI